MKKERDVRERREEEDERLHKNPNFNIPKHSSISQNANDGI